MAPKSKAAAAKNRTRVRKNKGTVQKVTTEVTNSREKGHSSPRPYPSARAWSNESPPIHAQTHHGQVHRHACRTPVLQSPAQEPDCHRAHLSVSKYREVPRLKRGSYRWRGGEVIESPCFYGKSINIGSRRIYRNPFQCDSHTPSVHPAADAAHGFHDDQKGAQCRHPAK
jgi:hypothetical protein